MNIIQSIVVVLGIIIIFLFIISHGPNNWCENMGYDYSSRTNDAGWPISIEPGYIKCCKTAYIDHVGTDTCTIIKKG